MYYSVTVLWWVLKFFGSDFSDISFSYSSLSIKILISFIILYAIGWKSGTRKCNRIQKGQALNCMHVLGCAVHTGKIKFFLFFKAKNVSHCWKLYWSVEDHAHVERRQFSNACIHYSKKFLKSWIFSET